MKRPVAIVSSFQRILVLTALFVFALASQTQAADEEGFVPLFNGKDLSGWVNANCAPNTWTVIDGMIHCTGFPTGAMRTERQYENFILELDWRHLQSGGNSGVFIWGTPISAPGQPFLRGIEVQVLDHGFNAKGKNEWYTTHGDVFPIHGATMKPIGRSNGQRSFPSEERSKGSPEWNHYRVECNNGSIRLHVNGKEVSGGDACNYRKGYLALESEGAPVEFKNIKIKELPATNAPAEMTAPVDVGFRPLYTGIDLMNWKTDADQKAHWKPKDWTIEHDGKGTGNLVSEKDYGDFELIVDWRLAKDSKLKQNPGILVRGIKLPAIERNEKSGAVGGKWNRYLISLKGDRVTVTQNGTTVIDNQQLGGIPALGPVGVEAGTELLQFGNFYIRRLGE